MARLESEFKGEDPSISIHNKPGTPPPPGVAEMEKAIRALLEGAEDGGR